MTNRYALGLTAPQKNQALLDVHNKGVSGLIIVSSVAEMSALDVTSLDTDDVIYVSGHHAGLHYGGGIFRINKASTTTVDNGVTFAATAGRWIRSGDVSTVDVTWFGAKINDATFDSRQAFNNAFFYLTPGSIQRNITAPLGDFYYNTKQSVTDNSGLPSGKWATLVYGNTKFQGAGKYQTKIIMHDDCPVDTPCIRFNDLAENIELSDFYIDGNRLGRGILDDATDEDEGIDGKRNNNIHIHDVYIRETGQDGIDIDGGVVQLYDNITIEDCNGFAMHLTQHAVDTAPSSDNVTVTNCQFRRNAIGRGSWFPETYAVNIEGGWAKVDNCIFEENYAGIIFQREFPGNKLTNCTFTYLTEIIGDNLVAVESPNTTIENNTFNTNINKGVINIKDTAIGSTVSTNTINVTHATIAGSASYAIRIADKSKAIHNEITCSYVGVFLGGNGAKAVDNTIDQTNLTNSAAYPIICNKANCLASINTILSSAGANITRGIFGSGATNFSVTNNVISDQRGSIRFSGTASGGQISGNVGDNVVGHDTILMDAGSTGCFITGNTAELTITDSGTNIVSNNVVAGVLVA